MKRILLTFLCFLMVATSVTAQDVAPEQADTVKFAPKQLIVPGALIAVGAVGVGLPQTRQWVADRIGTHRVGSSDDYIRLAPLAGYMLLDFAGVKSRRPFVDRLIVGVSATVIMSALTYGTKFCVREERPNGESFHSFPSGHAALAFMGAELLRQDYGPWVGACGYVVAGGVGVMRLLKGAHWFNDVLAGAGIGILSAKAAEWLLPFNRRWLGLDRRRGEMAVIVPTYMADCRGVGLTAAFTF